MALTIDATIEGTAANSYITLADAEIYFEKRLHTDDWTNASDADKNKALVQACRIIDSYCTWLGCPSTTTQALKWPRQGIYYDCNDIYYEYHVHSGIFDEFGVIGTSYYVLSSTAIPQQIIDGQCELAFVLLGKDTQSQGALESLSISGLKIGLSQQSKGDRIIPAPVWSIMAPLGKLRGASGTVKLMRC